MLSGRELVRRVKLQTSDPENLSIIPKPDLKQMSSKGGASIDLKLGRWFMTLRQARISRVELSGFAGQLASSCGKIDEKRPRKRQGESDKQRSALDKYNFVPFGDEFILHPGRFVIGVTLEWVRLPLDAGAYVTGKSSLGRHGLVIETAAAIHPRFTGCLALEIANVGEVPLVLRPGMPIAQLLLHKTGGEPQSAKSSLSGRRKPFLPILTPDEWLSALTD